MNFNKIKNTRVSKHQASKKGFKHQHKLSKGQLKDQQKINSKPNIETGEGYIWNN